MMQGLKQIIPTNWLDPLLTGGKAVIEIGKPLTCPDVERLLFAIKERADAEFHAQVRRELAKERGRVRRVITKKPFSLNPTMAVTDWSKGYQEACRDLLAALSRRKGTR